MDLTKLEDVIYQKMNDLSIYAQIDKLKPCENGYYHSLITGMPYVSKELSIEDKARFLLSKKIGMYYLDKKICLILDENWLDEELSVFLYKCLDNKVIIDSLNDKTITLHINTLQQKYIYEPSELFTEKTKKEREKRKDFGQKIIWILEDMGIKAMEIYNWEMFGICNRSKK